jgi:hypothetical protein
VQKLPFESPFRNTRQASQLLHRNPAFALLNKRHQLVDEAIRTLLVQAFQQKSLQKRAARSRYGVIKKLLA